MIRQNLLVLALVLLTITGCSVMPQNGCQCGAGRPSRIKTAPKQRVKSSKCKCRHCAAQAPVAPLFPGDPYGQMNYGAMNYGSQGCESSYGIDGCSASGGSCSAFGQEMQTGGCSPCGSSMMHGGMMPGGMPMQESQGCNCGHDGGSMQMQNFAPQMMPSQMHQPMAPGHAAPLAPAQIFEAPRPVPGDGSLPPVPNDSAPGEGAPPATPAVDPVSWQMSSARPVSPQLPYPAAGAYTRRVEPIPTAIH